MRRMGWVRWLPVSIMVLATALTCREARAESLRIISYNVWGVPVITPDRAERIAAIGQHLAALEPDIVLLQEVWLDEDAAVIGAALAEAGVSYQHHVGSQQAPPKGSGLWIGSRYPFDKVVFEPFTAGHKIYIPWHLDWMAQKGVLMARVRTPNGELDVADTHLQANYLFTTHDFVQLSQALQMGKAIAPTSDAPPLIATGDLNVRPGSLPYRALTERAAIEAVTDFELDAVMMRNGKERSLRVTRVAAELDEPVRLDDGKEHMLSDHPCVIADLDLSACKDCVPPSASKWPDLASEVRGALLDETAATERMMLAGRVLCVALPVTATWSARRARGRRRIAYMVISALLLVVGGWLGYVGWNFGPYQLRVLAEEANRLP